MALDFVEDSYDVIIEDIMTPCVRSAVRKQKLVVAAFMYKIS
jgi:hypothetical protein